MLKATPLYEEGHQWVVFARDPQKVDKIIDTNQYMVISNGQAILLDPGGIELFSPMLTAILNYIPLEGVTDIFASHQDPDIISSLGLWDNALPHARLHLPWIWEGFVRHFGSSHVTYCPIADDGGSIHIGGKELQFIPAHYVHASGNFHVYDPEAKILMSGDVGAALEPEGAPMFVEDFNEQIPKMKMFHQRWMPSNRAKNAWINRVRQLDIDIMAPQHGRIYRGDDVQRFLDWFEALDVGIAV